jgi:hypothetical protein
MSLALLASSLLYMQYEEHQHEKELNDSSRIVEPNPDEVPQRLCGNCGYAITADSQQLCSNCGKPLDVVSAWPPPPDGESAVVPKSENPNEIATGTGLGCLTIILSMFVLGEGFSLIFESSRSLARLCALLLLIVTLFLQPAIYFWVRMHRRTMARVMGFVLLIFWAIVLGLGTACAGFLSGPWRGI